MNSEKCTADNTITVNDMLNNMAGADNTANDNIPNIKPKKARHPMPKTFHQSSFQFCLPVGAIMMIKVAVVM